MSKITKEEKLVILRPSELRLKPKDLIDSNSNLLFLRKTWSVGSLAWRSQGRIDPKKMCLPGSRLTWEDCGDLQVAKASLMNKPKNIQNPK